MRINDADSLQKGIDTRRAGEFDTTFFQVPGERIGKRISRRRQWLVKRHSRSW